MANHVEVVRRWEVEELTADMRPLTDDDVPIALDGRRLDTAEKVIAYLHEINAQGVAEEGCAG